MRVFQRNTSIDLPAFKQREFSIFTLQIHPLARPVSENTAFRIFPIWFQTVSQATELTALSRVLEM